MTDQAKCVCGKVITNALARMIRNGARKDGSAIKSALESAKKDGEVLFCSDLVLSGDALYWIGVYMAETVWLICDQLNLQVDHVITSQPIVTKRNGTVANRLGNLILVTFKPKRTKTTKHRK